MQTEFKTSGTGFKTGAKCAKSNLFKCTDNNVEYMQHVAAGEVFPSFPGGNGKGTATWFPVTVATDGARKSFTAVRADSK